MRPTGWRPVATAAIVGLVVSGCLGATPREEFQEIIRARGGGVTTELFGGAVAALEDHLGTTGLVARSLVADPERAVVTVEVRDPDQPANLDRYLVVGGAVEGEPTPVLLSDRDDLDAQTFVVDLIALDSIEDMADTALAEFGAEGGWVDSIIVSRVPDGEPTIVLSLQSPRARASATFTAAGDLVEVVRR